jgi:hypothetical protein
MSGFEGEDVRQKRAVYLHEAGHAVMAILTGKFITSVFCDGKAGQVEATNEPADDQNKSLAISTFSAATKEERLSLLPNCLSVYESEFLNLLGGLAGESLEPGRAVSSILRGAEDLTFVHGQLNFWFSPVPTTDKTTRMTQEFYRLMEKTFTIINTFKGRVFAIAEALEEKTTLNTADIAAIIEKSD